MTSRSCRSGWRPAAHTTGTTSPVPGRSCCGPTGPPAPAERASRTPSLLDATDRDTSRRSHAAIARRARATRSRPARQGAPARRRCERGDPDATGRHVAGRHCCSRSGDAQGGEPEVRQRCKPGTTTRPRRGLAATSESGTDHLWSSCEHPEQGVQQPAAGPTRPLPTRGPPRRIT